MLEVNIYQKSELPDSLKSEWGAKEGLYMVVTHKGEYLIVEPISNGLEWVPKALIKSYYLGKMDALEEQLFKLNG